MTVQLLPYAQVSLVVSFCILYDFSVIILTMIGSVHTGDVSILHQWSGRLT